MVGNEQKLNKTKSGLPRRGGSRPKRNKRVEGRKNRKFAWGSGKRE